MDEKDRLSLWNDYDKTKSPKIKEQLIIEYVGLVKVVAGRLGMYLGYTVEFDDLVGYGIFGLIDAVDKFDVSKGIKFETYATLRIRGSILDQIRKMDWIPRSLRQKQKQLENSISEYEIANGNKPDDEQLANYMGIKTDELKDMKNQTQIASLVSLDEYIENTGSESNPAFESKVKYAQPEQIVERNELKKMLAQAIESLNDNEQKVIAFYYYEELTLKEISRVLDVSESRVSQIHTKALKKMKETLGDNMDVFNIWNTI